MFILLTGASGGIGSAIKESLKENTFLEPIVGVPQQIDWLIFAHGFIGEDDLQETFLANTLSCISFTNTSLPNITKGVIYISSTSGIKGNTKFPIYSASKAALNSYAETMSRKHPELQFYALCPGPTDTKMWRNLKLEGKAQSPNEVAKAIKEIMEGKFKSGDIITVRDGKICLAS